MSNRQQRRHPPRGHSDSEPLTVEERATAILTMDDHDLLQIIHTPLLVDLPVAFATLVARYKMCWDVLDMFPEQQVKTGFESLDLYYPAEQFEMAVDGDNESFVIALARLDTPDGTDDSVVLELEEQGWVWSTDNAINWNGPHAESAQEALNTALASLGIDNPEPAEPNEEDMFP